jgi:hypothetical protein
MKKLIVVFIFMAVISPVFSQNNSRDTSGNMHYFNVPIERIYYAGEGYVIQYRKGVNQLGTIGIPYAWFTEAGGKAEILKLPGGTNWPSMSVFYRDGEFSYVRLYVHREKRHLTWSVVPQGADVSRHFKDPESFKLEFR